jgi:hypothetical protein
MNSPNGNRQRKPYTKPEMTAKYRRMLFCACVAELANNAMVPPGFWARLSANLPVSAKCAARHWKQLSAAYEKKYGPLAEIDTMGALSLPLSFFGTRKKDTGQNSRRWIAGEVSAALVDIPKSQRQTVSSTAAALGVPQTTFFTLMTKEGAAKKHTSSLKPKLTEEHMVARVEYCLGKIEPGTLLGTRSAPKFMADFDEIDVDEKWFNMTYDGVRYYLSPMEEPPDRRTRHKGYIDKVMFLSAVARPKKLPDGSWFDGKIGFWPFGRYEAAKRASKLRAAGTLCWKNIGVNANVFREMMMDEVVPAIMARWPESEWNRNGFKIKVQQDGASSHINVNGNDPWHEFIEEMGLENKIFLYNQPAQSPDLNINDLGFFRAIEAIYKKECPRTYDDIIAMAKRAY